MTPQLESKLKQIRLSGMVQALPARLAQAHGGNLTHLDTPADPQHRPSCAGWQKGHETVLLRAFCL